MNKPKRWWYRASREEKLAQVKAGIELGMTSKQVAMNCGCYYDQAFGNDGGDQGGSLVGSFARYHGTPFPHAPSAAGKARIAAGNVVRHKVKRTRDITTLDEAYDIFGNRSRPSPDVAPFEEMAV